MVNNNSNKIVLPGKLEDTYIVPDHDARRQRQGGKETERSRSRGEGPMQ